MLLTNLVTQLTDQPHEDLIQEKMGRRAFPQLAFLDAEGNVLAAQGNRSVAGFEKTLKAIEKCSASQKKVAAGDASAKVDLFFAEIDLGKVKFADAQTKAKTLEFTKEQQAKIDALMVDLEVSSKFESAKSREEVAALGKDFAEMKQVRRVPTGDVALRFWTSLMSYAEAEKDVKTFEDALTALKAKFGSDDRMKRMLDQVEQRLEKLKAGAAKDGDIK